MKSSKMFEMVLKAYGNLAGQVGAQVADDTAEIERLQENLQTAYGDGRDSRQTEVDELKDTVNQLTRDVAKLVDERHDLESKLRGKQLDSYNAGVQDGRNSEVARETVKVMTDTAARTIFSAIRVGG